MIAAGIARSRRIRPSCAGGARAISSPSTKWRLARAGADAGCAEALFTLGDRPEGRWPAAAQWLAEAGYDSTLDYLRAAAVRVLETSGLLPHLNPGVMTWQELLRLRPVAPSMGMMLETTSRRLFDTPGAPHYGSPDKDPAVRLRVLTDAGRANVPFTSGVLVGIGETSTELADSLLTLRAQAREYRAIAEVIVQNFRAKPDTALRHADDLGPEAYGGGTGDGPDRARAGDAGAGTPNLTDAADLALLLDSGVDDFGGISPLTPDHVNPERPWPRSTCCARSASRQGSRCGHVSPCIRSTCAMPSAGSTHVCIRMWRRWPTPTVCWTPKPSHRAVPGRSRIPTPICSPPTAAGKPGGPCWQCRGARRGERRRRHR